MCGLPRGTDIPSTRELQQMPGLGGEEQLERHMETSWEETGTRRAVQKKPESLLNDNRGDDGCTERSSAPWVCFSSRWRSRGGREELEEALLLHP